MLRHSGYRRAGLLITDRRGTATAAVERDRL